MATSRAYWDAAEKVKDDLTSLGDLGVTMYGNLEGDDDVGQLADDLQTVLHSLNDLQARLMELIPALRKVEEALEAV